MMGIQTSPAIMARAALPLTAALVYRTGDRCPACWRENWWLGRTTAECAGCGMPLALGAQSAETAPE